MRSVPAFAPVRFLASLCLFALEAISPDRSGAAELLTISEGLTSRQIVERLNGMPELAGEIATIPAEGSLLPQTYRFERGDSRQSLLNRMASEHDRALAEIWSKRADDLPIASKRELVTLASIVEREAAIAAQEPRVASVLVNRLRRGLPLQSGQALLYGFFAVAGMGKSEPSRQSLRDSPNPYNSFLTVGLPPGPIGNPGRAALEAAANPARTRDLYFVRDGMSALSFASSAEEHRQNIARLRQAEAAEFLGAVEATWNNARESRDPTALDDFARRFADSRHRAEAEVRARLLRGGQELRVAFEAKHFGHAILDEESTGEPGQIAARFAGMLAWNLTDRPGEHPSIEAALRIPDRDFFVLIRLHMNGALPKETSHMLDIEFATPPSGSAGGIEAISRIDMRVGESDAAHALAGNVNKGADGLFWLELAGEKLAANMAALRLGAVLEMSLVYRSGQRAVLTLAKGDAGDNIFEQALAAWGH